MVAGKVKSAMGLQKSPANVKPKPELLNRPPLVSTASSAKQHQPQQQKGSGTAFSRSLGVYFPRASAQVQPRPPDVSELLRLVEALRESESRLKTELLEQKLLRESVAIVPVLESVISSKDSEIGQSRKKIECLDVENQRLRDENEFLHTELTKQNQKYEEKIRHMQAELADIKTAVAEREREHEESSSSSLSSSSSTAKSIDVTNSRKACLANRAARKCMIQNNSLVSNLLDGNLKDEIEIKKDEFNRDAVEVTQRQRQRHSPCNSEETPETSSDGLTAVRSRAPRVPKPPPRPSAALLSSLSSPPSRLSSSASSPSHSSQSDSERRGFSEISSNTPPPPPPPPPPAPAMPVAPHPPPLRASKAAKPPPPPPPPPRKGSKPMPARVRRVPEVVEFYHTVMRRDSNCRRDTGSSGGGAGEPAPPGSTTKDMIGEIENRSAHLLAIKSDVETQGDFIRFLIKEIEGAAFADIEDVIPFVKWLDDELSFLVDERAVLKHFDWPEKKADALREAAFGYCDLKKLEAEVSSFRDVPRQPCIHALKKMQALFEKLEHGVYNLSRMRELATKKYKGFHIPADWMLDTGYVSQLKLASVKLALKYMKRISAELELVSGGPDEEELIIQGVKFAFRVHQFAGGFDVETMRAFEELRDNSRSCDTQCQHSNQHKFVWRSSGAY